MFTICYHGDTPFREDNVRKYFTEIEDLTVPHCPLAGKWGREVMKYDGGEWPLS